MFRLLALHVRAGRGLLDWSRRDLAREASKISAVSEETIKAWERSAGPINGTADRIDAVVRTFEAHGVELLNDDAPGVRLRLPKDAKSEGEGRTS
ncbi:hypothetical protein [Azospirillum argentinense]|uniref:hypothetical protein n=1 Tax=Azospirillum argentinense TaxID=2970906 RepID=UPI0032DE7152